MIVRQHLQPGSQLALSSVGSALAEIQIAHPEVEPRPLLARELRFGIGDSARPSQQSPSLGGIAADLGPTSEPPAITRARVIS